MAKGRGRGRPRKAKASGSDAKVRDAERGLGDNSGTEHDATAEANVANRRDAMRAALDGIYELDAEISALTAEHIAPLREDKSAIMKNLRERYGMTAKVFRARYYAHRLERDAAAANDEVMQDAIRELFDVCPVTGQGSFAAALDSVTPAKPAAVKDIQAAAARGAAPSSLPADTGGEDDDGEFAKDQRETTDPEQAWELGYEARKNSPSMPEALKRCPFDQPHQAVLRSRFEEGVEGADIDIKRQMGQPAEARA